ncbi:MAG TPA: hypothetical protein VJQ55_08235, partial [Candidatus Binatia bacterium]|nr:hypothetical protein [Candidatus Binatia bacterium]
NIKMSLDLDKTNNILVGLGNGKVCVQRRCSPVSGPVQFDIPQPMDGSWTIVLDLQTSESKRIGGTANATLSNGRVLPFTINGSRTDGGFRFNAKGAAGNLSFRPPESSQSSHNLSLFEFTKAKLLGQTVTERTTLFP